MKKLLFIVLICNSLASFSQDTTWTKKQSETYGTSAEKALQDKIGVQSDNRFLRRFVGFKEFYTNEISAYLQLRQDFTLLSSPDVKDHIVFVLTKNGTYLGNDIVPKVRLSFALDRNDRVVSGRFTGDFVSLAELFIYYWPQYASCCTIEQLRSGVVAVKHSFGDLVAFKNVNGHAVITVTKDSNISFPVPAETASN